MIRLREKNLNDKPNSSQIQNLNAKVNSYYIHKPINIAFLLKYLHVAITSSSSF